MTDFGLKVINSSGFVQVDSTFKNLGLRSAGATTSGGSDSGTGWYFATATAQVGSNPVVAFRSTGKCYLRYSVASGSTITYYFHCQGAGVQVSYWIFDDPVLAGVSGSYGLRVRDAAGSVVFDSRANYMRVLDAISAAGAATGDPMDSGFTRSYSGTPAVVQGQLRYQVINTLVGGQPPNATTVQLFTAAAVSFSGVNVTWKTENPSTVTFNNQQSVPPSISHPGYDYLVLDVSFM